MFRNRPGHTKYYEIGEEPFVRGHCCRYTNRTPGDRLSPCRGLMRQGEWVLLHRCERFTAIRAKRIGPDDDLPTMPALAAGPLANPPIPTAEEIQI